MLDYRRCNLIEEQGESHGVFDQRSGANAEYPHQHDPLLRQGGAAALLERKSSGYRAFSERDIETLKIVLWLKKAHMPLKEIARFIQLLKEGDASLHQRLELFERRRQAAKN